MATSFAFSHLPLPNPNPPRVPTLSTLIPSFSSLRPFAPPKLHSPATPCRSTGYNVQIVVGEDEPEEVLLRRFRREVSKAGVILECKRRKFFENKQEEKKRKAREASRRNRRRRFGPRFSSTNQSSADTTPKKARDDVEDNWDMPEDGGFA